MDTSMTVNVTGHNLKRYRQELTGTTSDGSGTSQSNKMNRYGLYHSKQHKNANGDQPAD